MFLGVFGSTRALNTTNNILAGGGGGGICGGMLIITFTCGTPLRLSRHKGIYAVAARGGEEVI